MKRANFRFAALLSLYQTQEDGLKQEISGLENQRNSLKQNIQDLNQKCNQVREDLSKREQVCDVQSFLHYLDGLQHRILEAENKRADLLKMIHEKQADLKKVWQERMRFGKLKERHQKAVRHFIKGLEQKESDEFSQRKRNR